MTDYEKIKVCIWVVLVVGGLFLAYKFVAAIQLYERYEVCGPNNAIVLDKKTMECYVLDSDKMKFVEWQSW